MVQTSWNGRWAQQNSFIGTELSRSAVKGLLMDVLKPESGPDWLMGVRCRCCRASRDGK